MEEYEKKEIAEANDSLEVFVRPKSYALPFGDMQRRTPYTSIIPPATCIETCLPPPSQVVNLFCSLFIRYPMADFEHIIWAWTGGFNVVLTLGWTRCHRRYGVYEVLPSPSFRA